MLQELKAQALGNSEIEMFISTVISKHLIEEEGVERYTQGDFEHIIDYFHDRQKKTGKLKLRKMSLAVAHELAKEWVEKMNKKAAGIVETEEDTEIVKVFDSGKRLVKLIGENAFKREGNLMGHCSGSYYGKSGVVIYSLRDENNLPHCTMEVVNNNNEVQQIKGKGNGPIHPRHINDVLASLELIGKKINEYELTYLGYAKLSPSLTTILDKCFTKVKWLTFNNNRFYYKHQHKLYLNTELEMNEINKIVKEQVEKNEEILIEAIKVGMPIDYVA